MPQAIVHVDPGKCDELHRAPAIKPGRNLARRYGEDTRPRVNSIHHQCVNRLGNGLGVEAQAPADGVIEAVCWTGSSFVMGVQSHPEFHAEVGGSLLDSGPIIGRFLERCQRRKHDSAASHPATLRAAR